MSFTKTNLVNATIIAVIAGILLAASLYARQYPIPCAIASAVVGSFAATLRLPMPQYPIPPAPIAPLASVVATGPEVTSSTQSRGAGGKFVSKNATITVPVATQTGDV